MGKAKQKKRQHYVPRSYLSAWTDPAVPPDKEPWVWLFPAEGRMGSRKSPKNIFEETDFYTIHRADGARDLVLEDGLCGLEGAFVTIRHKLARHEKLTRREYAHLLAFVAAMDSRTKATREFDRGQWQKVLDLMDRYEEAWQRSTPEQRQSMAGMTGGLTRKHRHERGEPTLGYDDVKTLVANPMEHNFGARMNSLLPFLERMNLVIIETADPVGFITSDDPCVIYDPEAYKRSPMFRAPALALPSVEITLPLSPRQLLILSWWDIAAPFVPVPERIVDSFNRRTRFYAHEHFVVNQNVTKGIWFEPGQEPENSWEKTRGRTDD